MLFISSKSCHQIRSYLLLKFLDKTLPKVRDQGSNKRSIVASIHARAVRARRLDNLPTTHYALPTTHYAQKIKGLNQKSEMTAT